MTDPNLEPPYLALGNVRPYPLSEVARQRCWAAVQGSLFRFSPPRWHGLRARLLRLFGADIPEPDKVVIFASARIYFPWKLRLEARTMISYNVNIYNLAQVTLRRGVNISQNTQLCAGSHDFRQWAMPLDARPIEIRENVWIASDVFVGPGVTIGELAVIGARSVVMRDQPARMVCAGHPCRSLRPRPDPV